MKLYVVLKHKLKYEEIVVYISIPILLLLYPQIKSSATNNRNREKCLVFTQGQIYA